MPLKQRKQLRGVSALGDAPIRMAAALLAAPPSLVSRTPHAGAGCGEDFVVPNTLHKVWVSRNWDTKSCPRVEGLVCSTSAGWRAPG